MHKTYAVLTWIHINSNLPLERSLLMTLSMSEVTMHVQYVNMMHAALWEGKNRSYNRLFIMTLVNIQNYSFHTRRWNSHKQIWPIDLGRNASTHPRNQTQTHAQALHFPKHFLTSTASSSSTLEKVNKSSALINIQCLGQPLRLNSSVTHWPTEEERRGSGDLGTNHSVKASLTHTCWNAHTLHTNTHTQETRTGIHTLPQNTLETQTTHTNKQTNFSAGWHSWGKGTVGRWRRGYQSRCRCVGERLIGQPFWADLRSSQGKLFCVPHEWH